MSKALTLDKMRNLSVTGGENCILKYSPTMPYAIPLQIGTYKSLLNFQMNIVANQITYRLYIFDRQWLEKDKVLLDFQFKMAR